ncbi:Sigma-54-dependent transcriptional activator (fragment) [Candidatus Desulfosporosinus infrequens]|uniref:Sigma-54-dependent transcriptional activator n=1 Tax=Candidatus Desulfosporosinus infrequens TaxID=2043169 RepID=A0A2U3LX13_9FIRM
MDFLVHYEWPGNVRELQNVVLRAIHLTLGREIEISDLLINNASGVTCPKPTISEKNLKQVIDHTERFILEKALKKHGSARGAAREIGLSHTAVLTKIRRYGLEHLLNHNLSGSSKITATLPGKLIT